MNKWINITIIQKVQKLYTKKSPSTASGAGVVVGHVGGDSDPISPASDVARLTSYWWRFLRCLWFNFGVYWWRFLRSLWLEFCASRMLQCCCQLWLGAWTHDIIGNGGIILLFVKLSCNDPCYILQIKEEWIMYSVSHYTQTDLNIIWHTKKTFVTGAGEYALSVPTFFHKTFQVYHVYWTLPWLIPILRFKFGRKRCPRLEFLYVHF